jgi:hypothetical protein
VVAPVWTGCFRTPTGFWAGVTSRGNDLGVGVRLFTLRVAKTVAGTVHIHVFTFRGVLLLL